MKLELTQLQASTKRGVLSYTVKEAEIWQVMCNGEIYQATLPELKGWIADGLMLPGDQVRKGNLRWIEAGRAPLLRPVFAVEENVTAAPPAAPTPTGHAAAHNHSTSLSVARQSYAAQPLQIATPVADIPQAALRSAAKDVAEGTEARAHVEGYAAVALSSHRAAGTGCHFHSEATPAYVCRVCHGTFCAACPKFVGINKTALCPLCGDLCRPTAEVEAGASRRDFQQSGFGLGDFGAAIRYPFGNFAGVLLLALFYGLLLLGGWRGQVAAYVVMFGSISLVIKKVAWGQTDKNFLPDFSSFSLWDDLVCPLFLGLGITVVTMGPMIVLVIALLFGWFSSSVSAPQASPFGAAAPPVIAGQSPETQISEEDLNVLLDPDGDPEKQAEAMKKVEAQRYQGLIPQKSSDAQMFMNVLTGVLASPGLIILLAFLCLGWAFFYYPMALTVAGYTEEFKAVVNPLVGLDTIRRMGTTYAKAFAM